MHSPSGRSTDISHVTIARLHRRAFRPRLQRLPLGKPSRDRLLLTEIDGDFSLRYSSLWSLSRLISSVARTEGCSTSAREWTSMRLVRLMLALGRPKPSYPMPVGFSNRSPRPRLKAKRGTRGGLPGPSPRPAGPFSDRGDRGDRIATSILRARLGVGTTIPSDHTAPWEAWPPRSLLFQPVPG